MEQNPSIAIAETLLPRLARAVVVNPDTLKVEVKHGEASSTVVATQNEGEAGDLIGKKGRRVRAFQIIAKLVGDKHRWPIYYGVQSKAGQNPPPASRPPITPNPNWDSGETTKLIMDVLAATLEYQPTITVGKFTYHTSYEVLLDEREPVLRVAYAVSELPKLQLGDSKMETNRMLHGDEALCAALQSILFAVGRLNGRTITIVLLRRVGSTEPQPVTAAGRYAGEVAAAKLVS